MMPPVLRTPATNERRCRRPLCSTHLPRTPQSGFVLITAALFLVVLVALGAAAMRTASVQERIAGVFYDRALALSAADAALSDGMEFLLRPDFDSSSASSKVRDGQVLYSSATSDGLTVESWVRSNFDWLAGAQVLRLGVADGIAAPLLRVKFNPGYVVDRIPNAGITTSTTYQVFRVTARGNGARAENSIYLQTLTRIPATSGN